jgi:hypothetical protein
MNKAELRAEPRVPVSFQGTLRQGERAVRCYIQNMCSRGFLIRADHDLPVGHTIELICHFPPDVACTVQLRHVNRDVLGARVTEVSTQAQAFFRRYLEEQHAVWLKSKQSTQ